MKNTPAKRDTKWTDEKLIRECRRGNEAAWSALIAKYKNLIFSIPIKFGLPHNDAHDIFQLVCAELLSNVPQLREPKALPKWLMQTTYHQCLRWKKQQLNLIDDAEGEAMITSSEELPDKLIFQLEHDQMVRDAMAELSPRCKRMVAMLFFEDVPRPYDDIAKELSLATGSIGFIRGRCLQKMRSLLSAKGFR